MKEFFEDEIAPIQVKIVFLESRARLLVELGPSLCMLEYRDSVSRITHEAQGRIFLEQIQKHLIVLLILIG